MPLIIPLAHDFSCPWCWIGFFQAKRLQEEFGARIEWVGYELWPEALGWPIPGPAQLENPNRPKVPSRLDLAYAAQGMEPPTAPRPRRMRTHDAHEALAFATEQGQSDAFAERLYRAYWERGEPINEVKTLSRLAEGLFDVDAMRAAVEGRRYRDKIIGFDEPAYASGIYNVPTFTIEGVRLAEQPYSALQARAVEVDRLAAS